LKQNNSKQTSVFSQCFFVCFFVLCSTFFCFFALLRGEKKENIKKEAGAREKYISNLYVYLFTSFAMCSFVLVLDFFFLFGCCCCSVCVCELWMSYLRREIGHAHGCPPILL